MISIRAEYDKETKKIAIHEGASEESWIRVCARFNDDVSRVCDVTGIKGYTGLFECCDDKNERYYYLVKEDKALYRMKHKHFMDNLGIE
jgi:hypothetical protein